MISTSTRTDIPSFHMLCFDVCLGTWAASGQLPAMTESASRENEGDRKCERSAHRTPTPSGVPTSLFCLLIPTKSTLRLLCNLVLYVKDCATNPLAVSAHHPPATPTSPATHYKSLPSSCLSNRVNVVKVWCTFLYLPLHCLSQKKVNPNRFTWTWRGACGRP
jgi:hypothetical protein